MKIRNFIKNWSENYFSVKENNWKREKLTSFILLLVAVLLFSSNVYSIIESYKINEFQISKDLYFGSNLIKSLIYQLIILLGLLIRFVALRFKNRSAFRLSEIGVLLSFFSWLGYLVWTSAEHNEISKIADVNYSSHLNFLDRGIAIILSLSFVVWFFYKIIFLIAVTWKTVRK